MGPIGWDPFANRSFFLAAFFGSNHVCSRPTKQRNPCRDSKFAERGTPRPPGRGRRTKRERSEHRVRAQRARAQRASERSEQRNMRAKRAFRTRAQRAPYDLQVGLRPSVALRPCAAPPLGCIGVGILTGFVAIVVDNLGVGAVAGPDYVACDLLKQFLKRAIEADCNLIAERIYFNVLAQ